MNISNMGLKDKARDVIVSLAIFGGANLCAGGNNINGQTSDEIKYCLSTPSTDTSEEYDILPSRDDLQHKIQKDPLISSHEIEPDSLKFTASDSLLTETNDNILLCLEADDEDSYTHTKVLEGIEDPNNVILEYPVEKLFRKYGKDKKPHPLCVSQVARNYRSLLGRGAIETTDIPQKLSPRENKITSETRYEVGDTIRFRLIDPELAEFFPENLNDQLNERGFETFFDKDSLDINKTWIDSTAVGGIIENTGSDSITDSLNTNNVQIDSTLIEGIMENNVRDSLNINKVQADSTGIEGIMENIDNPENHIKDTTGINKIWIDSTSIEGIMENNVRDSLDNKIQLDTAAIKGIIENKGEGEPTDYIYDIVVKSLPGGKSALGLYRDGKLFMTSYVSIGTPGRKTRRGQYEIKEKIPYKRSAKYDNSPMPLASNYSGGFYIHQGNVSGYPLSHGCIRLPGLKMLVLYSLIKNKDHVDIFIDEFLYESK